MGIKPMGSIKSGVSAEDKIVEMEGVEKLRNLLPNLSEIQSSARAPEADLDAPGSPELDQLQVILRAIRYIETLQDDLTTKPHEKDDTESRGRPKILETRS